MDAQYFSLTSGQLKRLLDGDLDAEEFISGLADDKPSAVFSGASRAWHDFSNLLAQENACGDEPCDLMPELTLVSSPEAVSETAQALRAITKEEFMRRCASGCLETPDRLWSALTALTTFYESCAERREAVLFNVR